MAILILKSEDESVVYGGTMMCAFAVSASLFLLWALHTFLLLNYWTTLEMGSLANDNIFARQSFC